MDRTYQDLIRARWVRWAGRNGGHNADQAGIDCGKFDWLRVMGAMLPVAAWQFWVGKRFFGRKTQAESLCQKQQQVKKLK